MPASRASRARPSRAGFGTQGCAGPFSRSTRSTSAASAQELVAGGVQVVPCSLPEARSMIEAKKVKALAIMGDKRTEIFPDVPTLKELGYGIVSNSPWGLAGPKGMDPKVVKILHDAFKKGSEEPAFQQILAKFDMEPYYLNTEDYAKLASKLDLEEKDIVGKLGLKQK